ncbi:MAG: MerR family transcriptional regulator, partial [Aureibaculum sp.]|nr:MerR family transcriptional regulator [Aureibaculum sp.]
FVLYLPMNEIHELGLLYLNYELTLRNYHTVYLGQNIGLENVKDLKLLFNNIHFVSYFTVQPNQEDVHDYLSKVHTELLKGTNNQFSFLGRKAIEYESKNGFDQISMYSSITEMLNIL